MVCVPYEDKVARNINFIFFLFILSFTILTFSNVYTMRSQRKFLDQDEIFLAANYFMKMISNNTGVIIRQDIESLRYLKDTSETNTFNVEL